MLSPADKFTIEHRFCWNHEGAEGEVFVETSSEPTLVAADRALESEQHYFVLRISRGEFSKPPSSLLVGLMTADNRTWFLDMEGFLHHNGQVMAKYVENPIFFDHDWVMYIGVLYQQNSIAFFANGKPLGIAFSNLPAVAFYPAFNSMDACCSVTVVQSVKPLSLYEICKQRIAHQLTGNPEKLEIPRLLKDDLQRGMAWMELPEMQQQDLYKPMDVVFEFEPADEDSSLFTDIVDDRVEFHPSLSFGLMAYALGTEPVMGNTMVLVDIHMKTHKLSSCAAFGFCSEEGSMWTICRDGYDFLIQHDQLFEANAKDNVTLIFIIQRPKRLLQVYIPGCKDPVKVYNDLPVEEVFLYPIMFSDCPCNIEIRAVYKN